MSTQAEALRLADELDAVPETGADPDLIQESAAELRRLAVVEAQRDALRAELKEATEAINDPAVNNLRTLPESIRVLCVQCDALLEALKDATKTIEHLGYPLAAIERARAAIKAVEETK